MARAQLLAMSALLVSLGSFTIATSQTPQGQLIIATREQIADEFTNVPCKNEERQKAVKSLFERMGAPSSDIIVEEFKGVENVVVRRKGASEEKIVIGAHYDKVEIGCGAVDIVLAAVISIDTARCDSFK